jgi:hypothetical protein
MPAFLLAFFRAPRICAGKDSTFCIGRAAFVEQGIQDARSGSSPADAVCSGGQGTEPNEQNTQQSPGLGFSNRWQRLHSWNHRQASAGMVKTSL